MRSVVSYLCVLMMGGAYAESLSEVFSLAKESSMSWRSRSLENSNQQLAGEVSMSGILPSLALQASQTSGVSYYGSNPLYGITANSLPFAQSALSMKLNVPLYTPASECSVEAAYISEKISTADYALFQNNFVLELAKRYFDVLKKDKSLLLANRTLVKRERFCDDVFQRYEVGLVAMTDLKEARAGLDQAKSSQIQAGFNLASAQMNLKTIAGIAFTSLRDLTWQTELHLPIRPLEQAVHPSLTKAMLTTDYYKKQIEVYKSTLHPTLSGFSSYSVTPISDSISHSVHSISAGLALSWSPPGGMGTSAQIEQISYSFAAAQAQYHQTALEHASQRELYAQQSFSLTRQIQAQRETVISALSYLDAVEASFDAGQRTTSEVLDAQQVVMEQQELLYVLIYDSLLMHLKLGLENSYDMEMLLGEIDMRLKLDWEAPEEFTGFIT